MAFIRPISDLRNKANEISKLCHQNREPIFITKNGREDVVVMSHAHYERQQALLELYQKLAVAEEPHPSGKGWVSHNRMMRLLRARLRPGGH